MVFFTSPEDTRWNPDRDAVEFSVILGQYEGTVRIARRVFQRLLDQSPTPERCMEAFHLQRCQRRREDASAGRSKNASREKAKDGRRSVALDRLGSAQTQLSSSIDEPAFPSRPGITLATARSVGDGRSGATRSTASMASTGPSPQ